MAYLTIFSAILVLLLLSVLFVDDVPGAYRERRCMGRAWRLRFPGASKQSIRVFLALFASAFGIKTRNALLFGPDDELMAIYQACRVSPLLGIDALELETFARKIERQYSVSLADLWHEKVTLGELFERLGADLTKPN